jgi:hypothetical protein
MNPEVVIDVELYDIAGDLGAIVTAFPSMYASSVVSSLRVANQ